MCNCCGALLDRNEVTKLKFEGKTFHVYANQKEVRAWIVGCWIKVSGMHVLMTLLVECGMNICDFISVCYIVLHALLFSTCRTKRSSWHTLHPHLRHVSTFGSAEWRTKLSISESLLNFNVFHFPPQCDDVDVALYPCACSYSTVVSLKTLRSGLFVSRNMRCELPLTFSEWVCTRTRLQALWRSFWDMAPLSQPRITAQVPSALSSSEKGMKKNSKVRGRRGVVMSRADGSADEVCVWGLIDGKREREGACEGQSRARAWMELIWCDLLMTLKWQTDNILSASHSLGPYCLNKKSAD